MRDHALITHRFQTFQRQINPISCSMLRFPVSVSSPLLGSKRASLLPHY